MYKDEEVVTLTELLDMRRLGVNQIQGTNLQDRDMHSVEWIRKTFGELTGKAVSKTANKFIFDKKSRTTELLLVVDQGYVMEFRWTTKNPTEILKVWGGLRPLKLKVFEGDVMIEDLRKIKEAKEFEYFITGNKLILNTERDSKILNFKMESNVEDTIRTIDLVNLLYSLQERNKRKGGEFKWEENRSVH